MSTGRSPVVSARSGLRLAGLILVLAGLFGMHGLDGHNAVAMGSVPQAVMTEMPMSPAGADVGVMARIGHHMSQVDTRSQSETNAVGASRSNGMDMGMAAMCVAILAAALIALLRLLLSERVRPLLWVLARQTQASLGHLGRDPDPPSLIALSIQRC